MRRLIEDPLEVQFELICKELDIRFTRPEREPYGLTFDFYLPDFRLYVEVKARSTERIHTQIVRNGNPPVVVIVGLEAVMMFGNLLRSRSA